MVLPRLFNSTSKNLLNTASRSFKYNLTRNFASAAPISGKVRYVYFLSKLWSFAVSPLVNCQLQVSPSDSSYLHTRLNRWLCWFVCWREKFVRIDSIASRFFFSFLLIFPVQLELMCYTKWSTRLVLWIDVVSCCCRAVNCGLRSSYPLPPKARQKMSSVRFRPMKFFRAVEVRTCVDKSKELKYQQLDKYSSNCRAQDTRELV